MTSQLRPICLHVLRILSYLESYTFVFIVLDSAIAITHSVNYRSDYHHVCICIVTDNWRDFWVNISVVIMRIDHWLVHRETIYLDVSRRQYLHALNYLRSNVSLVMFDIETCNSCLTKIMGHKINSELWNKQHSREKCAKWMFYVKIEDMSVTPQIGDQ